MAEPSFRGRCEVTTPCKARNTPATKKLTGHPEKRALPANFPVPSQDVVLNFLLLFFVHIGDSIFEKLKIGRDQETSQRHPLCNSRERNLRLSACTWTRQKGDRKQTWTRWIPGPSTLQAPSSEAIPCYSRSHTGSETEHWKPGKRTLSPKPQMS